MRAEVTFGRFRAVQYDDGDVAVIRAGILGRGQGSTFRAWLPEQVEEALLWAKVRRKYRDDLAKLEAADECKALGWALDRLRERERRGERSA
jgi:hypothetical protein